MCESKNNEYLTAMKPTLYMMKMVCAMPFHIKLKNNIAGILSSKLISLIAIVACIIYHIYCGRALINFLANKNNFNIKTMVAKFSEIIYTLFSLMVPLMMLSRNQQMQDYWKAWEILQLRYENITGTLYISRKRKYITTATLFCIFCLILRTCYAAFFHYFVFDNAIHFIASIYSHLLFYTLLTYWFANCSYFRSTSEDILILGKRIIVEKKKNWKLNKLIAIWSDLNDLANSFNDAHSFLFLSIITTSLSIIVTNGYALINYSAYKTIFPFTFFSNFLFIALCVFLIICESSHSVYHQMCYQQKEALLQENTMKMGIPVLQSVMRFLQTVGSQDSAINFNGIFTLTRMELPAVATLCLNYLIVLGQFSED